MLNPINNSIVRSTKESSIFDVQIMIKKIIYLWSYSLNNIFLPKYLISFYEPLNHVKNINY